MLATNMKVRFDPWLEVSFFPLMYTVVTSFPLTQLGSPVSTLAASTKAEATVPSTGMSEGRSENIRPSLENMEGVVIPKDRSESVLSRRKGDRSEGLELDLIDPLSDSTPPPEDGLGTHQAVTVYPLSADVLSERDRRSRSEER